MKPFTERLSAQEWLEERSEYIGGYEVSAILAESEDQAPMQVWFREKVRSRIRLRIFLRSQERAF